MSYNENPVEHYRDGKYDVQVDGWGSKYWKYKGEYHREDGPAVEHYDGVKVWCINGEYHREDGPAYEWPDGTKEWWLNNVKYQEGKWKVEMRQRKLELLGI